MTISTTFTKTKAAGNGVTTAFSYPYPVLAATNLVVKLVDNITGVETPQTLTTHYTVSSTPAGSVTVTFLSAPAATVSITIDENIPFKQDIDLTPYGTFPAETVESGLDNVTMLAQQNRSSISRAVLIDPTLVDFTGSNRITANAAARAGQVIGFDDTGNNVQLWVNPTESAITASAAAVAAAASAAGALASEIAADNSEAGALASKIAADADAAQTAADRVQTGLDKIATAADRVQTGLDRVQTGLDRVQTGIDATTSTAAAASALGVDQGASNEGIRQANGTPVIFTNPNLWPDPYLVRTSIVTASGTGAVTRIMNRGHKAMQRVGGTSSVDQAIIKLSNIGLKAGDVTSFGLFLDAKNTSTANHFTLNIEELDAGAAVLATTTVNSPASTIVTGTGTLTAPQPVVIEALTLNASTDSIRMYWTTANTCTSIVSRHCITKGTRCDFKAQLRGHVDRQNEGQNYWKDGRFNQISKYVAGTSGTGSEAGVTFNGRRCHQITSTASRVNSFRVNIADMGLNIGDQGSIGVWVEDLVAGSTITVVAQARNSGGSLVGTSHTATVLADQNVCPMFVAFENMDIAATVTLLALDITCTGAAVQTFSRMQFNRNPKCNWKEPDDVWDVIFQGPILVDTFNGKVLYPACDLVKNGITKSAVTPITYDATNQYAVLTMPSTTSTSTPMIHYFDIAAFIAGTTPFKELSTGILPSDTRMIIILGYANTDAFTSKYASEDTARGLFPNEINNGNFAGGVTGNTNAITGTITATAVTDLNAVGVAYALPLLSGSGVNTVRVTTIDISDQVQGAPFVAWQLVYSSDATWTFTGASAPAGPHHFITQTNTATVQNPSWTKFITITANLRLYYYGGNFPVLAAGQALSRINIGVNAPSGRTNDFIVGGFGMSTRTNRIGQVNWRNFLSNATDGKALNKRMTTAEATIVTNTTNIASNTTAIAALAGASTTTAAKILVPKFLDMVAGRPITLYRESLIDLRNTPPSSRRLGFHASDANNKPYARNFDASVVIDPDKVGTSGRFVLQSLGTTDADTQNYKDVTIRVTPASKSSTPKIMCIGDSVTAGTSQEKMRAKVAASGATPTMVGTQANGMTGSNRGEGRSGWRIGYWTYASGSPTITPLALGGETAYMATPDPNVNPFLRASTGGDPAGIIFNGYVFDPAFYQTRFNAITAGYIPTPDLVIIAMGVNDVNSTGSAVANVTQSLPVMVNQIKAAWPSAKIGIITPIIGSSVTANDATHYSGANGVIAVRKKMLELYDQTVVANVEVMNHWPFMDTDFDWDATGSPSTDSQTGTVTSTKSDYLHPVSWGTDNYSEATFAWVMNKI